MTLALLDDKHKALTDLVGYYQCNKCRQCFIIFWINLINLYSFKYDYFHSVCNAVKASAVQHPRCCQLMWRQHVKESNKRINFEKRDEKFKSKVSHCKTSTVQNAKTRIATALKRFDAKLIVGDHLHIFHEWDTKSVKALSLSIRIKWQRKTLKCLLRQQTSGLGLKMHYWSLLLVSTAGLAWQHCSLRHVTHKSWHYNTIKLTCSYFSSFTVEHHKYTDDKIFFHYFSE